MSDLKKIRTVATAAGIALGAGVVLPLALSGTASAASLDAWERIAACESGDQNTPNSGNWSLSGGDADSTGGLQIQDRTWADYGGTAIAPHAYQASKAQQIAVAEKILAAQGPGAWVCNSPGHGIASGALSGQPADTSGGIPSGGGSTPSDTGGSTPVETPGTPADTGTQSGGTDPGTHSWGGQSDGSGKWHGKSGTHKSHGKHGKYTVRAGDTLSGIAHRHGHGDWSAIYGANSGTVANPDSIYPGQVLDIPSA